MTASILAILAGIVGVVFWWLRHSAQRRRDKLLAVVKRLKEEYAEAIANGDPVAIATYQRRLRELTASHTSGK